MTAQDYNDKKKKVTKYALEDFSEHMKYNNLYLIGSILLIGISQYYNINYLLIIGIILGVIGIGENMKLQGYKKGFSFGYDEGYEVMQEKIDSEYN